MMRNKKFIIGFLIFDAVAILVIVFVLLIHNPFAGKVAPEMEPTTFGGVSSYQPPSGLPMRAQETTSNVNKT